MEISGKPNQNKLISTYDQNRPVPPGDLLSSVAQMANVTRDQGAVVDVGSGTGLSTRCWSSRAQKVIGVEPDSNMRKTAIASTSEANVSYVDGTGESTTLADAMADIVTCSSALHWLEPAATFDEVGRILRSGGVFVAYGPRYPVPLQSVEIELKYRRFRAGLDALAPVGIDGMPPVKKHSWASSLKALKENNLFGYSNEMYFHSIEEWDMGRFVGWIESLQVRCSRERKGLGHDGHLLGELCEDRNTDIFRQRKRLVEEMVSEVRRLFIGHAMRVHIGYRTIVAIKEHRHE